MIPRVFDHSDNLSGIRQNVDCNSRQIVDTTTMRVNDTRDTQHNTHTGDER